jgi:retinol dehydrogenase-12
MQVIIVTGGYSGIGYELVKLLYAKNATVYIAGRNEAEGLKALKAIAALHSNSKGRLEFLYLDLSDLNVVKESAQAYLSRESRLDVLCNNAGVMGTPTEEKTAQVFPSSL